MDASVEGTLILPIKDVISYLCQWEFSNTNGTTVITIDFKNNESNISCRSDIYTILVTDGKNLDFIYQLYHCYLFSYIRQNEKQNKNFLFHFLYFKYYKKFFFTLSKYDFN